MNTKKVTLVVVILAVVLAIGAVYFLVPRNATQNASPQPNVQTQQASSTPAASSSVAASSATTTFDANDNLDQAVQDLNTLVK
jgi:uncharacterized protein HemX